MSNVINPKLGIFQKTPRVPLASLPPASLFQAITRYEISDYGGNVAVAVNGQWRFELPFRTTWTGRPPVGLVPAGTELQITDYANQKWISDGTYWRPAQGRVSIGQQWGRASQPLASLTGVVQGYFTIPGGNPLILAGMVLPHSRIYAEAHIAKAGANSTAVIHLRLSAVGDVSFPESAFAQLTLNAATGSAGRIFASAKFGSATNSFISDNRTPPQGQMTELNDKTATVNTAADREVSFTLTSASTADVINLIGYNIWLEA